MKCPTCRSPLFEGRFDAAFRKPDDTENEHLAFGIPARSCGDCMQLYVDPELLELLDLADAGCSFAIENDQSWRSRQGAAA